MEWKSPPHEHNVCIELTVCNRHSPSRFHNDDRCPEAPSCRVRHQYAYDIEFPFFVEAELMPFRTSPVVGEENDKRVVQFTVLLQRIQYPSDIPIHDIDHSGKDCHPTYQIFLPVFGQTIPCRKLVIRFILKRLSGTTPRGSF